MAARCVAQWQGAPSTLEKSRVRSPFAPTTLHEEPGKLKILGMSDQCVDLMLEHLRAIRGDLAEVKTDLVEIKQRLGLIAAQYANVSGRVDRMAGDIAPIKLRLDLVEV
jgi:hypothetical protein